MGNLNEHRRRSLYRVCWLISYEVSGGNESDVIVSDGVMISYLAAESLHSRFFL